HPVDSVATKRRQLGLPMPKPKIGNWNREEDALLGTERDRVIAKRLGRPEPGVADRRRKLGIPPSGIRRQRANAWKPKEEKLLGTAPDAEIARRIGRSKNAVKIHRQRLGIPRFVFASAVHFCAEASQFFRL